MTAADQILLRPGRNLLSTPLPNFARACGCVPVGGHPDKRPDSRPKTWECAGTYRAVFQGRRKTRGLRYLTGSRRLTGEPCPPQGTRLEATTIGLFWSQLVSRASYRRGLFFLPAVRSGMSPIQSKASFALTGVQPGCGRDVSANVIGLPTSPVFRLHSGSGKRTRPMGSTLCWSSRERAGGTMT